MSYRSVSLVPAVFACVVAGASLGAVSELRAQQAAAASSDPTMQIAEASASCLSAPKGATPAGSHWYYRIDRVTKRQCWYLREESEKSDDKFARAAPPPSAPVAAEAPQAPLPTPRKFSEARAEYVAQQARAESNPPARAETRSVVAAEPAAQDGPRSVMPNVLAPAPLSSVRWNEQPAPGASAAPAPPPVRMAAAVAPAVPRQPPQAEPTQADPTQPAVAEQPFVPAAADQAKPAVSPQKLLLAIAAALALAGITVSAIVRVGRMRARRAMKRKRTAMWDTARSPRKRSPQPTLQPVLQDTDSRPRRAAHPVRAPQDRGPQDRHVQDRHVQERHVQDRHSQDRPLQDRARAVRERPRLQPESYAPPNRRQAPVDRTVQERAPQDREHQVSEMLSRLARSAQH